MTASRNDIIQSLYNSPDVAAAINKMHPAELREDLRQEMFVVLCKMDEAKLIELHEKKTIRYYLVGVMLNMVKSDRSEFYKIYRRENERELSGMMHLTKEGGLAVDFSKWGDQHTPYDVGLVEKLPSGLIAETPHHEDKWIEKVDNAVNDLDPYEQDLLNLYVSMGQSCKPIAEATGIPERSIRFVIAQTREKLQKQIRQ